MQTQKKILFIAPEFFNFPELIRAEFERQGHRVFFVPDRPSKHALVKILIRKARFLLAFYIQRHYRRVFNELPQDLEEVFIIKGEAFTPTLIRWMRVRFSQARFQVYLWDSLKNSASAAEWFDQMDRIFSFDYDDAQKNPRFEHLPNFANKLATPEELTAWRARPIVWNLAFFGTVHSDRLRLLSSIGEKLPRSIKFFRYLYFQSPLLFYFRKFFDPYFKKFRSDEMSYKAKLNTDWQEIAASTVAILDLHHAGQTGLTHRTLECLGMGMKLVTTNPSIKKYPFYDERIIRVIDREKLEIDPEFLRTRSALEPAPSLRDLELPNWCRQILN